MTSGEKYDTIVVGAGISGLYATYLLQEKHGKNVLLLEAKDRIGGRLCATELKSAQGTDTWDLGGQWVGKTQHYLMQLLAEFGLETYQQYYSGTHRLMLGDGGNMISYSGVIPKINPLELLEMYNLMKKVTKLSDNIDLENVALHPNALEWDSMTLHTYMMENCKSQTVQRLFESTVRVIFGVDLSQMSLLYFLYYCKQGGNLETLMDSEDGAAQEFRVKGSMYLLCQKIAKKLQNIVTGEPVKSIEQTKDVVKVTTKSGQMYECENIILAFPPHLVNMIEFSPPLPNDRVRLGQNMPPGNYMKVVVTYKTAFWKDQGMSGQTVYTSLPCSTHSPLTVTFDGTTSYGNPAIIGFICAEDAIYWGAKTMAERKEAVLQSLAYTLGEEALNPIEYIDRDWSKEPYNGGAPVGIMKPRTLVYFHHALRQPFGRIHWAGTETARRWCGYIDGGLESAVRAVSEVVEGNPASVDSWKGSPAFSNYKNYHTYKQPSLAWKLVKTSIGITLVGVLGYYIAKKIKGT